MPQMKGEGETVVGERRGEDAKQKKTLFLLTRQKGEIEDNCDEIVTVEFQSNDVVTGSEL